MKKRNIYQNRSQELCALFESADNTSKIMCIPIDYAKKHHVAMFCNGYGDIIRKPFPVKNSPEGVDSLRSMGWLVASVNAYEAKKQRENLQASTDRLDLMGIASMLLNRRANTNPAQSGIYQNLRTIVRHRKKLVKIKTEM